MSGPFSRDLGEVGTQTQGRQATNLAKPASSASTALVEAQGFAATAGAIGSTVGAAADLFKQYDDKKQKLFKEETVGALGEQFDTLTDALAIAGSPERAQKAFFSEEALKNPSVQAVKRKFDLIKLGISQGKTPGAAAKLHAETILKDAVDSNPQYAKELRQMARNSLGIDPTGELLRQMTVKPEMSPEQQAERNLRIKAAEIGISPDDLRSQLHSDNIRKNLAEQHRVNAMFSEVKGDAAANAAKMDYMETFTDFTTLLSIQAKQGGVIDPSAAAADFRAMAANTKQAKLSEMIAKTNGQISPEVLATFEKNFDTQVDRTLAMIKDSSYAEIVKGKNESVQVFMKSYAHENYAALAVAHEVGGDPMVKFVLETAKSRNPRTIESLKKLSPAFGALIEGGRGEEFQKEVTSFIYKLKGKNPAEDLDLRTNYNDVEKATIESSLSMKAIRSGDISDAEKSKALRMLLDNVGPAKTLEQFDTDQMEAQIRNPANAQTKRGFYNMFSSELGSTTAVLQQLKEAAADNLPKYSVKYNKTSGKFEIDSAKLRQVQERGGTTTGAVGRNVERGIVVGQFSPIQEQLDNLNLILQNARRYQDVLNIDSLDAFIKEREQLLNTELNQ